MLYLAKSGTGRGEGGRRPQAGEQAAGGQRAEELVGRERGDRPWKE